VRRLPDFHSRFQLKFPRSCRGSPQPKGGSPDPIKGNAHDRHAPSDPKQFDDLYREIARTVEGDPGAATPEPPLTGTETAIATKRERKRRAKQPGPMPGTKAQSRMMSARRNTARGPVSAGLNHWEKRAEPMLMPLSGPSRPPVAGGRPTSFVILLHGRGSNGEDLLDL
jgi:hypothetical protein